MYDRENRASVILNAGLRYGMCRFLSRRLPLFVVTEYPRSGGTWFSQLLSAVLQLPFPRNQLPTVQSSIMHGHYLPNPHIKNLFCMMRDGRDVILSYYYFLFTIPSAPIVERIKAGARITDFQNIEANLPRFIHYIHQSERTSFSPFRFTWDRYVRLCMNQDGTWPIVRYEDLLEAPARTVTRAVDRVTGVAPSQSVVAEAIDSYTFERQTGRARGTERQGFLRRGIAGEWREKFTIESREVFDSYYGEALLLAGYEQDRGWISG